MILTAPMPFLYPIKAGNTHIILLMEREDMQINYAMQHPRLRCLHHRMPRILSGICC